MKIPIPTNPDPKEPRLGESSFRAARQTERTEPSRLTFRHRRQREQSATVTFSPLAWLKLLMFLHAGEREVGGFAISAEKQPLYIEDFVTVKQTVTSVTVAFDDTAVADFFDDCMSVCANPRTTPRTSITTSRETAS